MPRNTLNDPGYTVKSPKMNRRNEEATRKLQLQGLCNAFAMRCFEQARWAIAPFNDTMTTPEDLHFYARFMMQIGAWVARHALCVVHESEERPLLERLLELQAVLSAGMHGDLGKDIINRIALLSAHSPVFRETDFDGVSESLCGPTPVREYTPAELEARRHAREQRAERDIRRLFEHMHKEGERLSKQRRSNNPGHGGAPA